MITLLDIDNMFPETHDGSVYSDMYKDRYGVRPRGKEASFQTIEDFDVEFAYLCALPLTDDCED